jgi:serine/threonine protein kinase
MAPPICPTCGNEIDPDDPQGLCPACLVKQGVRSEGEGDPLRTALQTKLGGQYRVIRLLGRGGMGAVYLARDLSLDREVAIKVIKAASDERATHERFRREARTAARLSHPNIVPLYAFGEVEGMPYFVMGYVRGESLGDRLRRDGRIPEEDARRILAEIADGLDHAHRQGVVHRDVKPDNVLLDDESGRALLTDFGLARGVGGTETVTQHGSVVGTPQYMSPEQASGRADIDGRSDIYSLGVMAYAMIAGRLPFDGTSAADVLSKQITQEPAPLASMAPTVSGAMAQAVQRCLAKDPGARWQDAHSLELALGMPEETQLPDALHGVESRGVLALAFGGLFLLVFVLMHPRNSSVRWAAATIVFGYAFIYVLFFIHLRREGFATRDSHRVFWREPAWWVWWYPRQLRRRGNVWPRVPVTVRSLRATVLVLAVVPTIYVPLRLRFDERHAFNYYSRPTTLTIELSVLMLLVAIWAGLAIRARRDLKRGGLAPADAFQVMYTVPASRVSFWARPHIAAILAPAPREITRSNSPHDYLQSIRRDADTLSGPLRPLGAEAGVAARQLVDAVEQAERQIADLARSIEPGEEERLTGKIEALASVEEYAPMRVLLEKQLQIVREMSNRIGAAKESRNRRVEMLKTLSLHVASLRTRLQQAPSEVRQLSDTVRALCDEIERQAQTAGDRGPDGSDLQTIERTTV